jgi:hypothetical protein
MTAIEQDSDRLLELIEEINRLKVDGFSARCGSAPFERNSFVPLQS